MLYQNFFIQAARGYKVVSKMGGSKHFFAKIFISSNARWIFIGWRVTFGEISEKEITWCMCYFANCL